jgi:hydroxyacylglutathione hydrolase
MKIKTFTFNPFQENTFVVYDDSQECIIIDAGCYDKNEQLELVNWLSENNLTPVKLISTHSHLDHVFGNQFVCSHFDIPLGIHREDLFTLESLSRVASMYGIPNVMESPAPSFFIEEGDQINVGKSQLEVLFVPGHAPGHIVFVSHQDKFIVNGDCLFNGSIGRTDLPGGNHDQLINNIRTKLFTLPEDYTVHCGHGPTTTIGKEVRTNPFF